MVILDTSDSIMTDTTCTHTHPIGHWIVSEPSEKEKEEMLDREMLDWKKMEEKNSKFQEKLIPNILPKQLLFRVKRFKQKFR